MIHTVKGFGIVNKSEIDVFLELPCFFYDPADVGNLISDFSAFPKTSLNVWKFTVHILLKPSLENFEHYFNSMWNKCNRVIVWEFFGIPFFGIGLKTVATAEFSEFPGILSKAFSQYLLLGFDIIFSQYYHLQ